MSSRLLGARHNRCPEFFLPSRVLLQDLTGVPCVVDLASLRDARSGVVATPAAEPQVRVDLVVDHSVQIDCSKARCPRAIWKSSSAATTNAMNSSLGTTGEKN